MKGLARYLFTLCFFSITFYNGCLFGQSKNALDGITKDVFEPQLMAFAKEQVLDICIYDWQNDEKFKVKSCERLGSIIIQDLEGNEGKVGSCRFKVHIVKTKKGVFHRRKPKEKDKGYVIINVSGIFEVDKNGKPRFVRDTFVVEENHGKTLKLRREKGEKYRATIEKYVPLAIELAKYLL